MHPRKLTFENHDEFRQKNGSKVGTNFRSQDGLGACYPHMSSATVDETGKKIEGAGERDQSTEKRKETKRKEKRKDKSRWRERQTRARARAHTHTHTHTQEKGNGKSRWKERETRTYFFS